MSRDTICPHNPKPRLSYLAWHADAERRDKRGERQVRCPECVLWQWPDNLCDRGRWAIEHPPTVKHIGGRNYIETPGEPLPGGRGEVPE